MRLAAITEELMNFLNTFLVLHEQGKTQGGRGWRGGRVRRGGGSLKRLGATQKGNLQSSLGSVKITGRKLST